MSTATNNEEINASSVNIAAADAQLAHRPGAQTTSDKTVPDYQPAKKKKPNNRKNKKKRAAENAETAEASQADDIADITGTTEPIDSDDPFYDQLKSIEVIKRGDHGAASEPEGHAEATKTVC